MSRLSRAATVALLALLAPLAAACGNTAAPGATPAAGGSTYFDGQDYPAENGKAAVIQYNPNPPTMPPALSDKYTRWHREIELHPDSFTGLYAAENPDGCPPGLALVVGTVRGKSADALARIKKDNLPSTCAQGVAVQQSELSSAATLYDVQKDVYNTLGATAAGIDWPTHKVVVNVPEVTDELRAKAAALYGEDVVLDIVPEAARATANTDRGHDVDPFYAGARFYRYPSWDMSQEWARCTFGIPWKLGTSHAYTITAGHCLPYDGASDGSRLGVKTSTYTAGDNGYGAGRLHTASAYGSTMASCGAQQGSYGDLALIDHQYWPLGAWMGRGSSNRIWQDGTNGVNSAPASRWATYNPNSMVRVSGSTHGDINDPSHWKVTNEGDWSYSYTPDGCSGTRVVYQQSRATKDWGQCADNGDSGGPVSQEDPDYPYQYSIGGVLSGASGGGGDAYIGQAEGQVPGVDCVVYFTSARFASYKWGGGMN